MHGLDGRGGNAAEASSEYEPAGRAVAFFPAGRVVSVLSGLQGVSGARRDLRHNRVGRCRKVKSEGEKGRERAAGKSGGGTSASLYLAKGRAGR
jgi:hypothetical protein